MRLGAADVGGGGGGAALNKMLPRTPPGVPPGIPPGTPPVRLYEEDARLLPSLGGGRFEHIVTSPPYPGTYDHHTQHRLRLDWLGLQGGAFAAAELGARREESESTWSEALRDVLVALARVLKPGGQLFLVMGDWIAAGHAVDAAGLLRRLAANKDWHLASWASVRRQTFSHAETKAFARRGKWEHLLHYTRPGTAPGPVSGAVPSPPPGR